MKLLSNKIIKTGIAFALMFGLTGLAFATNTSDAPSQIFEFFSNLLGSLVGWYLAFAGLVWAGYLLWHGFSMLGKSDSRSKDEAKDKFLTTVKVGFFAVVLPGIIVFFLGLINNEIQDSEFFNGTQLTKEINKLGDQR